jgi:hypothetical protein
MVLFFERIHFANFYLIIVSSDHFVYSLCNNRAIVDSWMLLVPS